MQTPAAAETERSLLRRARAGDPDAFGALTAPHRRELHVHCYRLLGSRTDADDLLQETLLAAWRGLDGFEGRASVRTWLHRIATNRCLNALRDAGRRAPTVPPPPFEPPPPTHRGDVTWLQPYPDALLDGLPERAPGPHARYETREAVELAFVVALQRMPPRQAAVLLLRDVLGYGAAETADLLDTTQTAVKGALQRARAALDADRRPASGSAEEQRLAKAFADAFVAADVDRLVGLLTDDAWLRMPPAPHEYHGPAAIGAFWRVSLAHQGRHHVRLTATRANNQPAFTVSLDGAPAGLVVLTVTGGRITTVTRFLTETPR